MSASPEASRNFTKVASPESIRIELQKTSLAQVIGSDSGLFYVPSILRVDSELGTLEQEHLGGFVSITELIGQGDERAATAMDLLGRSIAAIHRDLHLPLELSQPLAGESATDADDEVFVHGDLTTNNVGWDVEHEQLVIVDWSTSSALGGATLASRYLDLVWLCASVFWEPAWARRPFYPAGTLCDRFLSAYASASPRFSSEAFLRYDGTRLIRMFHRAHSSPRIQVAQWARRRRWARWQAGSRVLRSGP